MGLTWSSLASADPAGHVIDLVNDQLPDISVVIIIISLNKWESWPTD